MGRELGEGYSYHVFLSFRGPDTYEKFIRFLYDALTRAGLSTCVVYDKNLTSEEEIDSKIREGIRSSMSAIVVFSENFAYSKWCLDELLQFLERKRTSAFNLLPVYYDGVEPADIKYQRKNYGDALEKHKKIYEDRIDMWRAALKKIGDYQGMIVAGKMEKFLNKIAKKVRKELGGLVSMINPPPPSVNPQLDGIIQSAGFGHISSKFNDRMPNPPALQQAPHEDNNIKEPQNENEN